MFIINDNRNTDPALNLALEEHCYRTLDPRHDYVLFYINQPSIIIGNHQNPYQEFNFKLAEQKQIRPMRRISGGGTVYHDLGNLNFSFITGFNEEMLDYFKRLLQPILDSLHRLGVPALLTKKNNILVEGRKISGNSQHTNMRRMLSHGTLLFDADLDALHKVLAPVQDIIHSRAVASIPSTVTNISGHLSRPMKLEHFLDALLTEIAGRFGALQEYRLTAADRDAVNRLAAEKYQTWAWTYGRSPEFTAKHKFQIDSDDVEVLIRVKHAIIEDIKIAGHQPDPMMINQKRENLIGKRYDPAHPDLF